MSETQTAVRAEAEPPQPVNIGRRMLRFLLPGDRPVPDLLPESVRYAMEYRGAQLSGEDVESLLAKHPRAAFYLSMKAADEHPMVQAEMLSRLAGRQFDYAKPSGEAEMQAIIQLGTTILKGQPGGNATTVAGEKLGQFSRHGFTGDLDAFDRTLKFALTEKPKAPLFMVANYPYIALDVLARHSLAKGNLPGIINPDHLNKPESSPGFIMRGQGADFTINALESSFDTPPDTVIFDDVVRKGVTRSLVMAWAGRSAVTPVFVAATHVSL